MHVLLVVTLERVAELMPIVLERAVRKLERAELMPIVLERPDLC
jgi:hypothetical protein